MEKIKKTKLPCTKEEYEKIKAIKVLYLFVDALAFGVFSEMNFAGEKYFPCIKGIFVNFFYLQEKDFPSFEKRVIYIDEVIAKYESYSF